MTPQKKPTVFEIAAYTCIGLLVIVGLEKLVMGTVREIIDQLGVEAPEARAGAWMLALDFTGVLILLAGVLLIKVLLVVDRLRGRSPQKSQSHAEVTVSNALKWLVASAAAFTLMLWASRALK